MENPSFAGSGGTAEIQCPGEDELRAVLGLFATGVTVVTTGGEIPHAMTANAFTSVSMGPPLVLVCVNRTAVAHRAILAAQAFAVNVLSAGQEEVARHFADPYRRLGAAQFDTVGWTPGPITGAPLLAGRLVGLECGLWRVSPGGDHTVFLGRILSAESGSGLDPLLFYSGSFHRLSDDVSHDVSHDGEQEGH